MRTIILLLSLIMPIGLLSVQYSEPMPDIQNLVSQINADTLQAYTVHLQNYQTRFALADNHADIANWIRAKFQSFGFTNTWMQEYELFNTTQYNVIATIPGSQYPDIYIIAGAHYDSQSHDTSNYVFAPGADDNASGTAGLLEMARVMMASGYQPRCTIRFIAFSAEEGAGWGSEAYCDYAINEQHNIRVMVNMDMIAANLQPSNEFKVVPYTGSEDYCTEAMAISQQYGSFIPVKGELDVGSDSYIFSQNGFNAVFFFERYFNTNYHSSADVADILDFNYAAQITRAAAATTAVYANKPLPPQCLTVQDPGTGNTLAAQWEGSTDPMVSQYAVYCGTSADSLIFFQYTNECQCLITGLADGLFYHLAVASVNESGNNSVLVYAEGTPLLVPRQPLELAEHPSNNTITLTWAPNLELDIESYSIYRCLGQDEISDVIATIPAAICSFTDSDVVSTEEYYYYRICANDSQGLHSPFSEAVSSRIVSLDRGICVIDESKNFSGTLPFQPTDQAVDDFYAGALETFDIVHYLDLEDNFGILRLADIGIYSSICWHGNDNADIAYPYEIRDVLRQYVYMGGKVMFSIYFPSKAFELNAGYPADFPPDSFMYDVLGIAGVDYSSGARFKFAIPSEEYYPALQVDSLKTLSSWNGHIFGVEALEPANPVESIYQYASGYSQDTNQGILVGRCVGLRHSYGAGHSICLSFPLYNMLEENAYPLINYIFNTLFNEPSDAPADTMPPATEFSLSHCFPNPFALNASFRIENADPHNILEVSVFNLRGQLVKTVFRGYPRRSSMLVWDGRDAKGEPVSTGIYIIKATGNGNHAVSKILKLK